MSYIATTINPFSSLQSGTQTIVVMQGLRFTNLFYYVIMYSINNYKQRLVNPSPDI